MVFVLMTLQQHHPHPTLPLKGGESARGELTEDS